MKKQKPQIDFTQKNTNPKSTGFPAGNHWKFAQPYQMDTFDNNRFGPRSPTSIRFEFRLGCVLILITKMGRVVLIIDVYMSEESRNDWIILGEGLDFKAIQGDLKGC